MAKTTLIDRMRAGYTGETAGPSTGDTQLGYWMRIVTDHVTHAYNDTFERHGVTLAEWVILRATFDRDGLRPTRLATELGVSRGAVSKVNDRLHAKGLIAVRTDPDWPRAQIVTLTPAGKALVPVVTAALEAHDATTFGALSAGERTALLAMLQSMAGRLGLQG